MNDILRKLKEQGYRLTPQRRLIVEIFYRAERALTAAEVWLQVKEVYPQVSLDTVYRSLAMLAEMGVLIPISSAGREGIRYELAAAEEHHHHIVCVECGQAQCIDFCPITKDVNDMLTAKGYELLRHNLELFGVCAACRRRC